jgi:hypothetical protein
LALAVEPTRSYNSTLAEYATRHHIMDYYLIMAYATNSRPRPANLGPFTRKCAFVFRNAPREVIDVLDPGVYWKLVPVTHWCGGRDQSKEKVKEYVAIDKATNAMEWNGRPAGLGIMWNKISDRKFGDRPRIQTD